MLSERKPAHTLISLLAAFALIAGILPYRTAPVFASVKKPAQVKWISVKRSGTKLVLKWKKAKNAKKYQIYQKAGSGKWSLKRTQKKRMYAVKVSNGKTHLFKVRGLNGKKKGVFSVVRKIVVPKESGTTEEPETYGDFNIQITREPEDIEITDGKEAVFSLAAEGEGLVYQWYRGYDATNKAGEKIDGADRATLRFMATLKDADTFYYCTITGEQGRIKSRAAKLAIQRGNRAYITEQPRTASVIELDPATFRIEAIGTGEGELRYQWYVNDTNSYEGAKIIPGEVNPDLTIAKAYLDMDGRYYYCRVNDDVSMLRSNIVRLTVNTSPKRAAVMRDLTLFLNENGVLSGETITIDGVEFFVLAKEDGKCLILAKDYWMGSVGMLGNWTNNIEDPGGKVDLMGKALLKACPSLDMMAVRTRLLTAKSRSSKEYKEYELKVFLLTEADVSGTFGEENNTTEEDFTFDRSASHVGRKLPKAIAELYANGERVPWAVRTPSDQSAECMAVSTGEEVEVISILGGLYLRPALWMDITN